MQHPQVEAGNVTTQHRVAVVPIASMDGAVPSASSHGPPHAVPCLLSSGHISALHQSVCAAQG
ncbi:hypothetical protein BKA56DRAFT_577559 [Ilyonectria sp. MPI-CAGE-AT-0026]|nr:hypothetical protein BKA56DRAFT_577559 [Ilyonectria sp. MPI-CAGE-AT-0026]